MSPRTLFISAAVAAGLTAGATAAEATTPVATAAKSCGYSRSLHTTYVTGIKARGVSCAKAKDVIRAFNDCRHEKGQKGRCTHKVSGGFRCSESRFAQSPLSYDSNATCKKGGKKVKFHYQQNLD